LIYLTNRVLLLLLLRKPWKICTVICERYQKKTPFTENGRDIPHCTFSSWNFVRNQNRIRGFFIFISLIKL
ncbi:hypothetical protein DERF_008435, partial [Dermatophagoides farinae]